MLAVVMEAILGGQENDVLLRAKDTPADEANASKAPLERLILVALSFSTTRIRETVAGQASSPVSRMIRKANLILTGACLSSVDDFCFGDEEVCRQTLKNHHKNGLTFWWAVASLLLCFDCMLEPS